MSQKRNNLPAGSVAARERRKQSTFTSARLEEATSPSVAGLPAQPSCQTDAGRRSPLHAAEMLTQLPESGTQPIQCTARNSTRPCQGAARGGVRRARRAGGGGAQDHGAHQVGPPRRAAPLAAQSAALPVRPGCRPHHAGPGHPRAALLPAAGGGLLLRCARAAPHAAFPNHESKNEQDTASNLY